MEPQGNLPQLHYMQGLQNIRQRAAQVDAVKVTEDMQTADTLL
jgi:hypothetical protein